jgi:hypothetical protein
VRSAVCSQLPDVNRAACAPIPLWNHSSDLSREALPGLPRQWNSTEHTGAQIVRRHFRVSASLAKAYPENWRSTTVHEPVSLTVIHVC